MSWFEFGVTVCSVFFSATIPCLYNFIKEQREFVVALISLEKECRFNFDGRGNSKNPFQISCLEKVLNNSNFSEQYSGIYRKCLEVLQLAKEANIDQLRYRRHPNGVPMVPSTVQGKMLDIADEIVLVLSDLQARTFFGMFFMAVKKRV